VSTFLEVGAAGEVVEAAVPDDVAGVDGGDEGGGDETRHSGHADTIHSSDWVKTAEFT
jgi:hypothetical protein